MCNKTIVKESTKIRKLLEAPVMAITKKMFNLSFKNHDGWGLDNVSADKMKLEQIKQSCFETSDNHSKYISTDEDSDLTNYCPRTFDGIACWDDTPAGATAFQNCPSIIVGFDSNRLAYKKCENDGHWLSRDGEIDWTDYTNCYDVKDLSIQVNNLSTTGYDICIITILMALFVSCYYKILRCRRIHMHMNLLGAFLVNNFIWWRWYGTKENNTDTLVQNTPCQFFDAVSTYTMVLNYMWMAIEGVYLYLSFRMFDLNENITLRGWHALGYATALFFALNYGAVRYVSGNTMRCLADHSQLFWVLFMPVMISMFITLWSTIRDHIMNNVEHDHIV
ncbi:unnamed protein product, partial [Brenthis ino]